METECIRGGEERCPLTPPAPLVPTEAALVQVWGQKHPPDLGLCAGLVRVGMLAVLLGDRARK